MGVNYVNLSNGEPIVDLRSDTVTPEVLKKGFTSHDKSGEIIVGVFEGIVPTETINVASNVSDMDITHGKKLNVSVPVPDNYIDKNNILMNIGKTLYASGSFTGSGQNIGDVKINCGFKPKIFCMNNNSAIYSKSGNPPYSFLATYMIRDNDFVEIKHRTSFILLGNTTNGQSRGGQSSTNFFYPIDNGVQGTGTNVKFDSGKIFDWWAWG